MPWFEPAPDNPSRIPSVAPKIFDRQRKAANILVQKADCRVARVAEKTANALLIVVVIDAKVLQK